MKNFLKNLFARRTKLAVFIFGLMGLALVVPGEAHAGFWDAVTGTTSWFLGWIAYFISYLIATIFGYFIAIEAFFISVILGVNSGIAGSLIVTEGFKITLAVANLGFVLAIIVIAIMTILRVETYALKQTLWKLVAAAILVNFSLVIGATILNFSDTLSNFFLDSFSGSCAVGQTTTIGINRNDCFARALAGSFGPQKFWVSLQGSGSSLNPEKVSDAGTNFASILTPFLNVFFPAIFLIVTSIALGGLFIMLMIRYIYLAILLILMPIAWLLWIFPATSAQWHKWWSNFIKWTMFAPIVLFFIWLAIITQGGMNRQNSDGSAYFGQLGPTAGSDIASAASAAGGFWAGMLGTLLQMSTMVAMVFAGLFMAHAMGITFADATIKGATAVTSGFGRLVGRKGLQAGGAALNKLKVREGAQKLQQTQFGKGMGKWNPLRYAGAAANYGTGWLGRGMENITVGTREDLVKDAKKRLADKTDDQLKNNMSTLNAHERVAATQMLFERGAIEKIDPESDIGKDFENFNQAGSLKKFNKQGRLADDEILSALPYAMEGNFTKLDDAVQKFIATLAKSDISSNKQLNDIFGGG
ncbi:hypothetical protein, partial [Nocardioides sp.]|uniref:hypothetical protein n=1 Tax=Nocardioides sp. TaxID=35761 RepID=UPI002734D55F